MSIDTETETQAGSGTQAPAPQAQAVVPISGGNAWSNEPVAPEAQAVVPTSGGNAWGNQAPAPQAQAVVQAQQPQAPQQQPQQPWNQQAPVAQQPQQPWNQQAPVAQQPQQPWNQQAQPVAPAPWSQQPVAPTLDQMWHAVQHAIDNMQIRNFITIRNKYSNGDLLAQNQQPQAGAQVVGFGLCMNKGSKKAMSLTTRAYNRLVCDLADSIANALGGWYGADVNATNASAIDVFDRNMVQRRQQPQQGYGQQGYGQQGYGQQQYRR